MLFALSAACVASLENAVAAAEGVLPCFSAGQLLITLLDVIDAASGLCC